MSKNITIAEGSQAKNFNNVHKLRTNVIGGGTQYWVPEDEAGAYANMGQKSITANGTYRASDDSKDGYSQVIVNVPPTRPNLTTKSITANGTYRAIDDNADGYSQVNVNVAGVGEATVTLDEPIGGDGNEHNISTDPTTGKPIDFVLPSSITITKMPNKMNYIRGENIDTNGMIVKAFKKDNTIWESTGYTGGVIPNAELTISPRVVRGEEAYRMAGGLGHSIICPEIDQVLYLGYDSMPVEPSHATVYELHPYDQIQDKAIACFHHRNATHYVGASDEPFFMIYYEIFAHDDPWGKTHHNESITEVTSTYTRDGKTVYYTSGFSSLYFRYVLNTEFNEIDSNEEFDSALYAWIMIYGNIQTVYKQTENVSWKRPKDNKVLKTEFTVHAVED